MKHSPTGSRNRFSIIKAGVDDIGVKDIQRTPTIIEELIGGIVRSISFAVLEAFSSGFYLIFCDSSQEEKGDHQPVSCSSYQSRSTSALARSVPMIKQ